MTATVRIALVLVVGLGSVAQARAQTQGEEQSPEVEKPLTAPAPDLAAAAGEGRFLPATLSPRVGRESAVVLAYGGYDGARSAAIANVTAEVRLWGPIAIRGGAEYSVARREPRPTIGGRVQLLHQTRQGIDGAVGVFYRAEGFTEPEGEIETFVSLGWRNARLAVLGNLVYGQDWEGNERDGEVRAGALYSLGRWALGLDGRCRFALGAQRPATGTVEPKLDLMAGPVAVAALGPVAIFAEAGPSLLKVTADTSVGVAALGGVGSVF